MLMCQERDRGHHQTAHHNHQVSPNVLHCLAFVSAHVSAWYHCRDAKVLLYGLQVQLLPACTCAYPYTLSSTDSAASCVHCPCHCHFIVILSPGMPRRCSRTGRVASTSTTSWQTCTWHLSCSAGGLGCQEGSTEQVCRSAAQQFAAHCQPSTCTASAVAVVLSGAVGTRVVDSLCEFGSSALL
jgi:hypothetical protein